MTFRAWKLTTGQRESAGNRGNRSNRGNRARTRAVAAASTVGLTLATGSLGTVIPQAVAHDSVLGGSPTDGEVLDQFPHEITLEFSGVPKEGFNNFALTDKDSGEVLYTDEPTLDGRELSMEVPEDIDPGAGSYQLGYQITSSDGHATRGAVAFTVSDAPAGQDSGAEESGQAAGQTSTGSASPSSSNNANAQAADSSPVADADEAANAINGPLKWILALGAIMAAAAVAIVLVAKKRQF